ncbi:hypothetical protein ACFWPP_04765 [Streptomyces anulatus]|uniref:hypothetical protein n=1 Tax=Streptomyces anulatus TaxID=1892 RepID=UPI0036629905
MELSQDVTCLERVVVIRSQNPAQVNEQIETCGDGSAEVSGVRQRTDKLGPVLENLGVVGASASNSSAHRAARDAASEGGSCRLLSSWECRTDSPLELLA